MNRPTVSIIIPVYNVEHYIRKCMKSIIDQTYKEIEIIVVIDGSTDKSEDIITSEFQSKDDRIKVLYQPNGGLSSARNTGMNNSTGEYLLFVDSDDWIREDTVELLVNQAQKNNSDVCIFNMCYVYQDGTVRKRTPRIKRSESISGYEALKRELLGEEYRFHAPNKFCLRSLYVDHNIEFPNGKLYEDMATTYKVISQSSKVSLIDQTLYFYLQKRRDSITGSGVNDKMFNDLFEAVDGVIDYIRLFKEDAFREAKQVFYVENVISFCNYIYNVDKSVQRKYIKKMKSMENWNLMKGLYNNKLLSRERKVRGLLICRCWPLYRFILLTVKGN